MQELERMINIYHTAFFVFLILAIVFFIVSVLLFFRFNIRGIFDMRTGRGARKTIQKMQEYNAQTGKLRQDIVVNTPIRLSPEQRILAPPTEKRTDALHGQADQAYNMQASGSSVSEGSQETQLLVDLGAQETTLLHPYNETTVLSPNQTENNPQPEKIKLPGAFRIEKEIMWVHTEEML